MSIKVISHCTYDDKEYEAGDTVTGKIAKVLEKVGLAVDDKKAEQEAE